MKIYLRGRGGQWRSSRTTGTRVPHPIHVIWGLTIPALVLGLLLVDRFSWLAEVNRGVGIILAGLGLVVVVRNRRALPREIVFFAGFILWAGATGLVVGVHQAAVLAYLRQLVQCWALAMGVAAFAWVRGRADRIFVAMFAVALVTMVFLFTGGRVQAAESSNVIRATSFLSNPNALGMVALWGVMSVAWLWTSFGRSLWRRVALLASVPAFIFGVVLSASRKSFLVLILFGFAWYMLAQVWGATGKIAKISGALLIAAALFAISSFLLPGSTLEHRITLAKQDPRLSSDRVMLYQRGFELFRRSPVMGVGLGNFLYLSGAGEMSHSDSMEVLSTTGIVGFLLYASIYFSIIHRIFWLSKRSRQRAARYYLGLCVAIIGCQGVLGLGAPLFLVPFHWVILAGIVGMLARWQQTEMRVSHVAGRNAPPIRRRDSKPLPVIRGSL